MAVTREVCDHCQQNGQKLHLETGQETADALLQFISDVHRDNLFINFDPANMILYGSGEPIAALQKVGRYVRSVHCKDAKWAARPGKEWGQEVPLGQGDVGIENFLRTLKEIGYTGPLTIEREIPAGARSDRRPRSATRSSCSTAQSQDRPRLNGCAQFVHHVVPVGCDQLAGVLLPTRTMMTASAGTPQFGGSWFSGGSKRILVCLRSPSSPPVWQQLSRRAGHTLRRQ